MKNIVREQRILKYGSPYYSAIIPTIAAGGYATYMAKQLAPDCAKYLPLDYIDLTNMSTVNVYLQLDDGDKFLCPAGTIKTIEDRPYRRLRITNMDATAETGADNIVIQMQKQAIKENTYLRRFTLK